MAEKNSKENDHAKVRADLAMVEMAKKNGCIYFLKFVNENYAPNNKKLTLTEEMLSANKLKRTMTTKFTLMFHPDKNVNEPRHI